MPALPWDRLMETCVRQNGDIFLTAGCAPPLRMAKGLAALQVPPLEQTEIEEMASRLQQPYAVKSPEDRYPFRQAEGYRFLDISYLDGVVFRASVFGESPVRFIVLTRLENSKPE